MRLTLALTAIVLALASPAAAQDGKSKTKNAPIPRTYIESIDMSSSEAALRGFLDAYAAEDFLKAYLLLSPDAKAAFVNKIFEFNEAQLFPGLPAGAAGDPDDAGEDVLKEIYLDGPLMFDRLLVKAKAAGALAFDFEPDAFFSPTFEQADQARYTVDAKGQPEVVIISTIKLSNGDWRVERVVWATSDPDATPWGFK